MEILRLQDLIFLQRGFDITKNEQEEGSIPVVSSSGISSFHNVYKVKGPGVVIGRKGTLGTAFLSSGDFWPHDTTLWVKDFKGNNPKFIYYFLKTLKLERFDSGASNPTLNRNHIHKLKITVPEERYRELIASILSAYDELIENNNQRIQLLETMAEEIYKEWFVRLRFPGYQDTPVVDGVPEGWEKKSFEEVAEFINGYAFKPSDWKEEGIPIVKIAELKNGVTDKTPRNNGLDIPQKYHVSQGDLLFSWSADLEAYLWNEGAGLLNQHIFKVVPYQKIPKEFVFYSLKVKMEIFKSMSNGATMQHIKRSELGRVFLEIPSDSVLRRFEEIVSPIIKEVGILKSKNNILQETRDLLLPRLISGKLSVEHLLEDDQPTKLNQRLEPVS